MSKTLLVLAASIYQLDTIRTAKALGYRVVTTDNQPDNPGHHLADAFHDADTTDLNAVLAVARLEQIDGVIAAATDIALQTAAYVAQELALQGVPFHSAKTLTEKIVFRTLQKEHRLPYPEFHPIRANCLPRSEHLKPGPWIIKPNKSSGSKGITICASNALSTSALKNAINHSSDKKAVVECYVQGTQHTCEGILQSGRVAYRMITDRDTAAAPNAATKGHRVPSYLNTTAANDLIRQLEHVFSLLDIEDCVFDCDFVAIEAGCMILEVTPRLGGNSLSRLIRYSDEFSLTEYAIRLACNDRPELPRSTPSNPAAIQILGVTEDGSLSYNECQLLELRGEAWVERVDVDALPGATVRGFSHGRHRLGEFMVTAESREKVDQRVAQFYERLRFEALA